MKYIYIITETGRAWNAEGLNWIETVFKPDVLEADTTEACMGAIYNYPEVLLEELTAHPDSYALLSYEGISGTTTPEELQELCNRLRSSIEAGEQATSWQIFKKMVAEDLAA